MYRNNHSNNKFNKNRRFFKRNSNNNNRQKSKINVSRYINNSVNTLKAKTVVPIKNRFEDFPINDKLKANIIACGYKLPTPIQDQTIPHILMGKDVLGIANTGTGKTAAFLIPLIEKIIRNQSEKVLIVAPTRELAVQINDDLKNLSRSLNIYAAVCIGGASLNRQVFDLRKNPNFVIGTPGRLKDLIRQNILNFMGCRNVVLDEVDRMVDIGFLPDIRFIISKLPQTRQSLFFSATIPSEVKEIIHSFLKNPVTISVKIEDTASGIDQNVIKVKDINEKLDKLFSLLQNSEFRKVLIFGRTKWGVEKLFRKLEQKGISVTSIHGNKSQNQRLRALNMFRQNQVQALIATDIAARGLDISDVTHVINFDEPQTYTDYVHRIGRTARANKKGSAITFVIA